MGEVVALIRTQSSQDQIKNSISKAIDYIDYKPPKRINYIAIKPNLCYYWKSATGYTTDPRVVSGIIDNIREIYGKDTSIRIIESDATAMRSEHAFVMLGYKKLADEKNVELFNLSKDKIVTKKVEIGGREITFKVPFSLLETDLLINVPKLKIMRETYISCALKNIFGCIASPRKIVYHPYLQEAIVGINKIIHPHLTFVDGLFALGHFPVKLNLIMGSIDPFSIDWIASKIMGYEPSGIGFLNLAIKEKIGNPNGITTIGDNLNSFRKEFPKENHLISKWSFEIMLKLLRLYTKTFGDIIPPVLENI
jgi:uncharacterized protein (DUF362 family)